MNHYKTSLCTNFASNLCCFLESTIFVQDQFSEMMKDIRESLSEVLLEAEAKLAEAQLEVLRARQRLVYQQFAHGASSSLDKQFSFDARRDPRV